MRDYRVVYEQDERGWWVASVPQVAGCHTQGRSLATARRRIREAIEVCTGEKRVELHEDIKVREARPALRKLAAAQKKLEQAQQAYAKSSSEALGLLVRTMSTRDASVIVGLSHQRIAQVTAKPRYARK